jgi:hypothetical protein
MTHLETYWILLLHSRQDLLAVLEKSPRLKSLTLKGVTLLEPIFCYLILPLQVAELSSFITIYAGFMGVHI